MYHKDFKERHTWLYMNARESLDFVSEQDKLFQSIGYDKVFEQLRDAVKQWEKEKNQIDLFKNFFNDYKKMDLTKDGGLEPHLDYILNKLDRSKVIIFSIDKNRLDSVKIEEVEKDNLIFPYHSFFVETSIYYMDEKNKEIYGISGFLVQVPRDNIVFVHYIWSRTVKQGFGGNFFRITRESFNKKDFSGVEFKTLEPQNLNSDIPQLPEEIEDRVREDVVAIIAKILFLIKKKEYTSYKKCFPSGYETRQIVYSHEVMSHKRHFWTDSGRFKIPLLSKEELSQRGYGIDELVWKDGELRQDVPFIVIGSFSVEGENKKGNQEVNLIKKRTLRQENKLHRVLSEIFPLNYILIHKRKLLRGLELDFHLPQLRLAFEYDGEQHFDRRICEEVFGSNFDDLRRRDRLKDKLCRKKEITLIRIKYDEEITIKNIKDKIKSLRPDLLSMR